MDDNEKSEILQRLTAIETKIDTALNRGDDHEKRIRRLEYLIWLAMGAAAVGGGIFTKLLGI